MLICSYISAFGLFHFILPFTFENMYCTSLGSDELLLSDSASCCFSNCLVICFFFERDQNQDEFNGLCNCVDYLFEVRHTLLNSQI